MSKTKTQALVKTASESDAPTAVAVSMPPPLQAYLQATIGQIDALGEDADSLWAVGQRGLQMEMAGRIIAGCAFKALCERSHNLTEELATRRIPRRTFYDAINVFALYAELPDPESVRALAQLGQTKAIAIASWPREEAIALANGQHVRGITLDDAVEMPTRDFMQAIKPPELARLEKRIAELDTDLDATRSEKQKLEYKLAHRFDNLPMPTFAAAAREEAVALTEKMLLCVQELQSLVDGALTGPRKEPEAERFQLQAAGTLFHALLPAVAQCHELLRQIQADFGDAATGGVRFEFQLVAAEAEHYRAMREQIVAEHERETTNREVTRDRATKRRGRPRKFAE